MLTAGFIFACMRYQSYLNSAKKIIDSNRGNVPFSVFLKKYFAANKKYGSTDRKQITMLCYNYYRLGKAMPDASAEEKFFTGTFLCEQRYSEFLQFHKPEWNKLIGKGLEEKISILGFTVEDVFPLGNALAGGIDLQLFCKSFFYQPDLFLRIRPGKKDIVTNKLNEAGLKFEMRDKDCIALANTSKLDAVLELDKEAVVQDLNSQKVFNYLKNPVSPSDRAIRAGGIRDTLSVWDCCAASGGKSILAYDILEGKIQLMVSDIRESILTSLKKRFVSAGIKNFIALLTDLSAADCNLPALFFQLIICDAPCTGSGTWSRTPEQLYFFKEKMINTYAGKQQQIISTVIPHLQTGGIFIYITCSVFKKENEEIVNFIKEKFHLQLVQMEFLKGYDKKADSMFAAVFIKK